MADRQLDTQKQFLLECIRLYKDLPTLWNVKSKVYYDRAQKEMGYKILLRKYREWYPKATKQDLKKKLNSLRSNYRKELRRYLASVDSGSEPVHKPTLWYYKEMSFLQDLQNSTGEDAESSMDAEQNYAILLAVDEENSTESHPSSYNTQESPFHEPATDDMDSPPREPSTVKVSTHRKLAPVTVVKKHVNSDEIQTNTSYGNLSENKDEYFHWALACASDLRKMERTQQVYAKKAIAEILMEGQLGLLHRHSVKVNEPQMHGHSSKSSGQFSSPPSYIQHEAEHHSQDLDKKPFVRNPLEDDP